MPFGFLNPLAAVLHFAAAKRLSFAGADGRFCQRCASFTKYPAPDFQRSSGGGLFRSVLWASIDKEGTSDAMTAATTSSTQLWANPSNEEWSSEPSLRLQTRVSTTVVGVAYCRSVEHDVDNDGIGVTVAEAGT